MLKKTTALFGLTVLLIGLFLPLITLAGHYKAFDKVEGGEGQEPVTDVYYEGIVPCGKNVYKCPDWNSDIDGDEKAKCNGGKDSAILTEQPMHCQLCHVFIMIDGIIDYVLINIIPPITVLIIVIGGVMFYLGGAKPDLLSKSKTLFKGVIIGLALIYGAYMIVGVFLTVLGATEINPVKEVFDENAGVFKINCPIEMPKAETD